MHLCFLTWLPLQHSALSTLTWPGWCFGDGDALGCCCCEELGVCPVLSPLDSLGSLLFVHLPTLEERTHKRSVVSLAPPAAVLLFHWQRPTCDCVCFIHLSILPVRMPLFSVQSCVVIRHLVICWPHVTVAFTNHCCSHKQSLSLDFYLLPESLLFPASLSFPPVGQMSISLSVANWVWLFGGKETHLCIYACCFRTEQSSLFYSLFLLLTFLLHSFLSLFLFWLMAKSQRMK